MLGKCDEMSNTLKTTHFTFEMIRK